MSVNLLKAGPAFTAAQIKPDNCTFKLLHKLCLATAHYHCSTISDILKCEINKIHIFVQLFLPVSVCVYISRKLSEHVRACSA